MNGSDHNLPTTLAGETKAGKKHCCQLAGNIRAQVTLFYLFLGGISLGRGGVGERDGGTISRSFKEAAKMQVLTYFWLNSRFIPFYTTNLYVFQEHPSSLPKSIRHCKWQISFAHTMGLQHFQPVVPACSNSHTSFSLTQCGIDDFNTLGCCALKRKNSNDHECLAGCFGLAPLLTHGPIAESS